MIIMNKVKNNRLRYYKCNIEKNLFDEYLVRFIYGSYRNRSPTRIVKFIFKTYEDAAVCVKNKVIQKRKNKYEIIRGKIDE